MEAELLERNRIAVENMFKLGIPQDQLTNFLAGKYYPLIKMMDFHRACREADVAGGPTMIACGGARGPGKSHAIISQAALDDCQRVAGLKVLFLRKIQKAAKESIEDLIRKTMRNTPHDYIPSERKVMLGQESKIIFGGFNNESDIDSYLGIEYDEINLEEVTSISEKKFQMIRGSLRSSKPNWRARLYGSTNPGGIGHAFFKSMFVLPARMGNMSGNTRFFPSTYKDNPFLSREYVEYLEGLTGHLGRAWRDGDWDAFEGQAFPEWNYDRHTCEPFDIPEHWTRWRGLDWGFAAPYCSLWLAKNPDTGRVYVYRESYMAGLTDRQQARKVRDLTLEIEKMSFTYGDPSMWSRKNQKDDGIVTSSADEYRAEGIVLTKADNDRIGGKRKVNRMLADIADGEPGMIIMRNCHNLIRTLPELIYDELHVEDVDTDQEDHAYDALRYALTSIRSARPKQAAPEADPWMKVKGI